MLQFTVTIDWVLLALVGALASVLSALYAVLLSTARGREVCERRTHWTVIGGHLLMALTMCFVSPEVAGLWLAWSVLCGMPLVIRSEWLRWQADNAGVAAVRGVLRGGGDETGDDRGVGDGHGEGGAGDEGSG